MNVLKLFYAVIRKNLFFFIPFSVFLAFGAIYLLIYPKGTMVLYLDGKHFTIADQYFKICTFLGNGYFVLILLIPVILWKVKYGIYLAVTYAAGGIGAQILKRIFDTPRPKMFFGTTHLLHFVPGVDIYSFHSFPSGHATTAFSFCFLFSILIENNMAKLFFFCFALSIAVSRVYLAEHFFIDIYFGSILGFLVTIIFFVWLENNDKFSTSNKLNHSFIASKK